MAVENAGFLGCGTVFLAPFINGVKSNAWYDLDECDKFEIKENVSEKNRKSGRCETYGQLKSQVQIKEPAELSISFSTMNVENFSTLLMAKVESDVSSPGVVNETISVRKGYDAHLEAKNITALVVKSTDGLTTFVEGTDYTIKNPTLGFITILGTGTIVDGDVVFESTSAGHTANKMVGGSEYSRRFSVKLVGTNLDTGELHTCIVHDVRLAPQSGVDFLAEDFLSGELTGKPVVDSVTNETYTVYTDIK